MQKGLSTYVFPKIHQHLGISGVWKVIHEQPKKGTLTTYFQRLINEVLTDCNFAMGYLDDIIIFSKTEEEHLQNLEEIFECLRKAGLKLKLQKCSFFNKHIRYLGHLISNEGIQKA